MDKIHIDNATPEQIDYAVAVGQRLEIETIPNGIWVCINQIWSFYNPTTDQAQCGELIDKFRIFTCYFRCVDDGGYWKAIVKKEGGMDFVGCNKSRLVSVCKAFLWSVYNDGLIPTNKC